MFMCWYFYPWGMEIRCKLFFTQQSFTFPWQNYDEHSNFTHMVWHEKREREKKVSVHDDPTGTRIRTLPSVVLKTYLISQTNFNCSFASPPDTKSLRAIPYITVNYDNLLQICYIEAWKSFSDQNKNQETKQKPTTLRIGKSVRGAKGNAENTEKEKSTFFCCILLHVTQFCSELEAKRISLIDFDFAFGFSKRRRKKKKFLIIFFKFFSYSFTLLIWNGTEIKIYSDHKFAVD